MTQRVSISDNSYLVPPKVVVAGAEPVYSITVPGVTTITDDATLLMYVYKGSTDKTSTFTTGSMGVSGNIITTKQFQSLTGGDDLFVTIFATMDGVYDCVCAFWLHVKKLTGK
jgi:hypothetical protein